MELWNEQKYVDKLLVMSKPDPTGQRLQRWGFTSNSLSGRERNRMFLQWEDNFVDVTLVSGADDLADGRSFGLIDFDQDGWQDIALMSLNVPRFKLYRNEMGRLYPGNRSFRFRLLGGHTEPTPSQQYSNRDALGARVLVSFESGKTVMMHRQAGEGFASQNSETLAIGIPQGDAVTRLDIRWPSGKTTVVNAPSNSEIVTIQEKSNEDL